MSIALHWGGGGVTHVIVDLPQSMYVHTDNLVFMSWYGSMYVDNCSTCAGAVSIRMYIYIYIYTHTYMRIFT